jgi:hypothetical protein
MNQGIRAGEWTPMLILLCLERGPLWSKRPSLLPLIVLFLILQRYFIKGIATGALRG